jgi:hemerythrin superfamily protein
MAKAKKRAKAGGAKSAGARRRPARQQDAIDLLKADHRQVEEWFGQFESTRSDNRKQRLAGQICRALKVHTQIEEEIFYPAFLEATDEEDIHHQAEIEHEGAKRLIADIESAGPEDDYYDARVSVLSEMIKHHVNEEEKRDGMFAKARQAGMDLLGLGKHLKTRKAELMSESEDESEPSDRTSRGNEAQARA